MGEKCCVQQEELTNFWKDFNTLADYPPGLDNRFYWLMDIQKLLNGANYLEELLGNSTDQVATERTTPEVLRSCAALTFEHYRASFDGITPKYPATQPPFHSSLVFEKAWHAAKELQPETAKPADICITPVLLEIADGKDASFFAKLWLQESLRRSDIQMVFDYAHRQIDRGQKAAFLSVVGERIAEILAPPKDSEATLFTAFLRLRAAQVTHDLAELGYYGEKKENIRQRAVAIEELSELAVSLKNDTRYSTEDPDEAQDLYKLAKYFESLYSKEQKALETTPPTDLADRLGAAAVSDTTTLQHAA